MRPLNNLLKKGNCIWNRAANEAFFQLKQSVTSTPVLALPDFSKGVIIETDAFGEREGIGVELSQDNNLLCSSVRDYLTGAKHSLCV